MKMGCLPVVFSGTATTEQTLFEPIPDARSLTMMGPGLLVYRLGALKLQGERNSNSEHQDGNVDIGLGSVGGLPSS